MNNKTKRYYILLFFLFFLTYAYFFQGGGWNQNIRICQIRAMLHQHTFSVDAYKEDSQNPAFEFINTGDWSYNNGHYYSNKAPGLSFLAVVPFGVAEYCLGYLFPSDTEKQIHLSAYVSTLCTTALFAALLCLLVFYVSNHFFELDAKSCLFLTLFFGFGTLAFSYSTIFYGHMPAAFFSFLAFVLAMDIKYAAPQRKKALALLAGFSAAVAVFIEPSAIVVLGCMVIYLAGFREGRKCVPFFLLGCIPLGVVQCWYNAVCFGSPLASSYQYANAAVMFRINGRLFGLPLPQNIIKILFLPNRGLFASSPVLLMALPGFVLLVKQGKRMPEVLLCAAIAVLFILLIVSYYAWQHASTPGPRYLLPAFPFIFLLSVLALRRFPKTFKAIGLLSIVINLLITLVGNEIPHDIENPLSDFILKNIVAGKISVNPLPFSNFENYSIETLAVTEQWQPNCNSFNLGEIFFPNSVASVLPLFCFWIIWGYGWKKVAAKADKQDSNDS